MSRTVLGISAFYHDAAAAIVRDGEIVAAAQEERFTRKKHDPRFPREAINYCLGEAFIEASQLDAIVFYDHPLLTLDRVVASLLAAAPGSEVQWQRAGRATLGAKLFVEEHVRRTLHCDAPLLFTEHHAAHAASAFYPSPFEEAAILTLDGVGEWATTTLGRGAGDRLALLQRIDYPHSLGLLYSAFTAFCGFKVNSGEYKLMGLAPYGTPVYADRIRQKLIDVRADGSFRLNLDYFGFVGSLGMTNDAFADLFGGPARVPETRITRREMDLAASVQVVLEDIVLAVARHLRTLTGSPNLVMAGGVALNCVANGRLHRDRVFDRLWIQPAAGDAGGALGAALLAAHEHFGATRPPRADGRDSQHGSLLGPSFSPAQIRAFLDRHGYPYQQVTDPSERAAAIAGALADGKVVGHFAGRMEFGPRALGARSILADPRRPDTQATMNLKIKFRESFRPFAPSVLAERSGDYFDLDVESPYMLLVAPVRGDRRRPVPPADSGDDDMLRVVNQVRSDIPAVTHVDYSARIQTVSREDHPVFYDVIRAFDALTGCAVLVNTSFNVRGEPMVCTPQDAYRCFMRTDMDVLALEDCLLWKHEQPPMAADVEWRREFALD